MTILSLLLSFQLSQPIPQLPLHEQRPVIHVTVERQKLTVAKSLGSLATVTAFNTVEAQTDQSPCVAAGGYICGRNDVIACPRNIPLHTWVEVEGMGKFECMDRTNAKYNGRYDVSFDKDIEMAKKFGVKQLRVTKLLPY